VAIASLSGEGKGRGVDVAYALLSSANTLPQLIIAYLLPPACGTRGESTSVSSGAPYLGVRVLGVATENGGRKSSAFSPDVEAGWSGEDVVVEDAGAPVLVSFVEPV
jgi:hypothetical protein